jgi:hypothetical protein
MRGPILASILGCALAACGPGVDSGDDGNGGDGGADDSPDADRPDPPENSAVYAHSSSTLYRVDPVTFAVTEVGPFVWPTGSDSMTDIAIDKDGLMIGISYGSVYRVDSGNASCTLLSNNLQGMFNGLSFVPAGQVGFPEGPDVLVGSRNTDGVIHSIDPDTGAVTPVGDMGGDWVSSGDIVSIHGFGTVATVTTGSGLGSDVLARLESGTFAATPIGTDTGYGDLWGVGFWGGDVFGFSEDGTFVIVNTTTGTATPVETSAPRWWGAAVTTAAPIVD